MATEIDPVVDNWYMNLNKGQPFQVVTTDEKLGVVGIQHFDGDIEEITISNWYEMDIAIGEEPESWAGAMDVGEVDDYGTEVTDTQPTDWSESAAEIRLKNEDSKDSLVEANQDVIGEGYPEE